MKPQGNGDLFEALESEDFGVSFLSFLPWRDRLIQGLTIRYLEDATRSPFDLGQNTSPPREDIRRNRDLFSKVIAGDKPLIITMVQMHGNIVKIAGGVYGPLDTRWESVGPSDGVITDSEDALLIATIADCVPIFLFDPARRVIGLLHAGWRGTAARIMQVGILRMGEAFGTDPTHLLIYLGPSIARSCYPVRPEVYRHFEPWVPRTPRPAEGWRVDLGGINAAQAVEMGVSERNVHRSRYCTHCSPELFYSHRASQGHSGRMAAFLALRKQISS